MNTCENRQFTRGGDIIHRQLHVYADKGARSRGSGGGSVSIKHTTSEVKHAGNSQWDM